MHGYYEQKYKIKLTQLETALQRKCEKIAQLKEDSLPAYLFIVRRENCILFFEEFAQLNKVLSTANNDLRVILCRISKATTVERALVMALARSKFGDRVQVSNSTIVFQQSHDADAIEKDIRIMFA